MNDADPITVIIRNPEGQYLARGPKGWEFTQERAKAIVFDYQKDHVAEHLDLIRKAHGPSLEAVSADPEAVQETCDGCHQTLKAFEAYFDGNRILCAACRNRAAGTAAGVRDGL
jgi:hypothetical protein